MNGHHDYVARLRRLLWQPPRAHGAQPRERVVSPLELFYDLVVVTLVAPAAHHLCGHLDWPGLGEFAAVFALIYSRSRRRRCSTSDGNASRVTIWSNRTRASRAVVCSAAPAPALASILQRIEQLLPEGSAVKSVT